MNRSDRVVDVTVMVVVGAVLAFGLYLAIAHLLA